MTSPRPFSFLPAAVLALFVFGNPLRAQSADPPPPGQEEEQQAEQGEEAPVTRLREEVVVSATLLEMPADAVGSSVTVITAEEIERRRKTTVLELLRTVPGIEVNQGGGAGSVASVFIRGGNSSHTLVLVDGVRVNGTTSGPFDFSGLTAENVERVEVLRGPQSLLYGSEAVAGVISITTRRGEPGETTGSVSLEGGLDGFGQVRLGVSGGAGRFDHSETVSALTADGVSVASERNGNREEDPYDNISASARLGARLGDPGRPPGEQGRLDLTLRGFDGESALDGFTFGVGPTDDPNFVQDRRFLTGALTWDQPLTARWRQVVRAGITQDEFIGEDPDTPFQSYAIENQLLEVEARSVLSLSTAHTLMLGGMWEERQGESRGDFDETVDIRSLFVQDQWAWGDRLFLNAGVRRDDHSAFGGETSWRVTSSWRLAAAARLHGSYGTAFKAPTFNELYFPGFGNPDLRPETSEGFDLGIESRWLGGRLTTDLTVFSTDFDDLIGFDFVVFRAANIERATADGVEFTLSSLIGPGLYLTASHTYMETEDLATGSQLPRRPRNRSTLSADFWIADRWSGSASLLVARHRIDTDGAEMDDVERVDLTVNRELGDWRAYLRVENLFDEDYEEINGFTSPGAVAALGLTYRF